MKLRFLFLLLFSSGGHLALGQVALTGVIVDGTTSKPVPFVSVALYRKADSVAVTGALADSAGVFHITHVAPGQYQLKTFFLGYKPQVVPVTLKCGDVFNAGRCCLSSRRIN
ncbi:carboxypeptidase regulatory-like domain-containing protein [Spirosoma endophyticum]|uniref:Carboxypeptidase regulatory-like domain-containing protein n=1 Tax=Spirosoma endophyticum TaxID=662367 RepID=A0A1I1F3I2_9BACT|nr:carboxypeptidase regulatory-like domain-containing protein [Spirosoma endophyticum]SFB93516.1 Carboxypeptidase regulatory-like domain-containing protein [Spirosoma endophyticum]